MQWNAEKNAAYDYGQSKLRGGEYNDKLYLRLTDFFHSTLANYYPDRIASMEKAVADLEEIEKLSDTLVPYIIGTRIIEPSVIIGREKEVAVVGEFLKSDKPIFFITGMGGIGKSTIARKALYENRDLYDNILYVYYDETILKTLINDETIHINTVSRDKNETESDYFERKLIALKKIAKNEKVLLVIDNYRDDEMLGKLLETNIKLLIIARAAASVTSIAVSKINENEIYTLFETYLGRKTTAEEKPFVDEIISSTDGHTLAVELIAKQIGNAVSCLSVEEAALLVRKSGFSHIAPEKVAFEKDLKIRKADITDIIADVFQVSKLANDEKAIVRVISAYCNKGILISDLCELLCINNKDCLDELYIEGWIKVNDRTCTVHPVITEMMCRERVDGETENVFCRFIEKLELIIETKVKTDYCFDSIWKMNEAERSELWHYTSLAAPIITHCVKYGIAVKSEKFKTLIFHTLNNMPRENEQFIREYAEYLADDFSGDDEMLLRLYDDLTEIYLEHHEYDLAYARFTELGQKISSCRDPRIISRYNYMFLSYYDFVLDGNYYAHTKIEYDTVTKMLKLLDKAIKFEKRANRNNTGVLLAEYLRCKSLILIRSDREKPKNVIKLLDKAAQLAENDEERSSRVVRDILMTYAWFYTYMQPDFERVRSCISEAYKITEKIVTDILDRIDEVVYPSANILTEWHRYNEAAAMLLNVIGICESFSDIKVYSDKKAELLGYLLDVYFEANDRDNCMKTAEHLENEFPYIYIPEKIYYWLYYFD